MKTAKELKEKYDRDLEELQKNCRHDEIDWKVCLDLHGNDMGDKVYQCEACWKILKREGYCPCCLKNVVEYTGSKYFDGICDDCKKKYSELEVNK